MKDGDNKRLVRNTIMLYFRMLVIMVVSLYASRVTLNVLGVEDFGIYNIVSGVVVLFSFISTALNSACNRFLSISVGKGEIGEIQSTFSTALTVHIVLMILVFLLLEITGFFVFSKGLLNIPPARISAATAIYHIASLSVCLTIVRVPFNASIIAHEDMDFYAYSSIVEAALKLLVVYLLTLVNFDKLISYSVLLLAVVVLVDLWYIVYCLKKFSGNRILLNSNRERISEMLSFCGWGTLGGIADISWQQGTNLLLNSFFGVTLNSAMGIANQMKTAVYSISSNLLMAANPQIIKSYSGGDSGRFFNLVYSMSKFPFFLMLVFTVPLILNMDFVLSIWLVNPPEYASVLSSLILVACNISILVSPLWTGVQAVGIIKKYYIVVSLILLLNVPATYIAFKNGYGPESMIILQIMISLVQIVWTLFHSKRLFGLDIHLYAKKVLLPILLILTIVSSISFFTAKGIGSGWTRLVVTFMTNMFVLVLTVFFFGLSKEERSFFLRYISGKLKKCR